MCRCSDVIRLMVTQHSRSKELAFARPYLVDRFLYRERRSRQGGFPKMC